jgi:hypothetical protein
VAERLFVFIQFEFPWALGPSEGRYLLRTAGGEDAERVVVIGTLEGGRVNLGGPPRPRRGLRARWRERPRPTSPEPAPVRRTRATVIDPVSLSAERQARAWLSELDREREILAAAAHLNRVLYAHRIAAADPYLREVSPAQATVIRAGWGEGERVAEGAWVDARELPWRGLRRGRDRSAALRPQERLAAVLAGRSTMLLGEELVLRARMDLDQGRLAHAATQLQAAYAAAIGELAAERRQDLAIRLAELEKLQPQVEAQARLALSGATADLDGDQVAHALGRLEAALRARSAAGFNLR